MEDKRGVGWLGLTILLYQSSCFILLQLLHKFSFLTISHAYQCSETWAASNAYNRITLHVEYMLLEWNCREKMNRNA